MCPKSAERYTADTRPLARNVLVDAYATVTEMLCLLPSDVSARDEVLSFLLDQLCQCGLRDEKLLVDAALRKFARGFSASN
jgi:hypothetical protein